ncbi:hypothetical protein BDZ45DRAFT_196860 [Acephala macrosclerotiorum]|nr:hypothetical protein BDZ45DRAFT_196860 [Acephala macrosclerotiorum]
MEQEMVPNWPDDLVLNPEETRLNHMTVNPAEMSTDFPDMDDDMFSGLLPSLRYLPGLSVLQREFPMSTLAEPNPETQGQDIDMFSMHPFDPNQNHSQMSGLVGGTSQYALDYEVTTRQIPHHVQQGYEAPEYNNQDFNSHRLPQSFNQAYNQPPFSMSTSMTSNLPPNQASFSSEPSYFTSQDANSSQVKDVTPAIEPPNAPRAVAYLRRKEKTRYRRSISRATRSPLPSSSPGENRMYHRGTSNSSISEESQNSHHIDAQQELNLLEKSFKPTSSFAQRKKAHLLKELADKQAEVLRQLKELMIDDEKFGGSSDVESNDLLTSTVPSSKVSAATSEILESDESADNTSVSSTPRQLENIPTSIEDGQPPCKHKPCQKCGFSTLYHCTYKGCGHATHQFADFVRHEGGEGHWPQNRFMCLDCCPDPSNPAHKVPTDENGNPICVFCLLPFYLLPGTPKEHFLGCTTARNDATTFGRVDHLIEHRRSIHGIIGANKAKQKEINQTAASWKYPIESDWPRECRICGVRFTTWDERMKHLGEHFQEDFKKSKRPFLPPKDFAPGPGPSRKDEDEDDDDTPNGGNGGPRSYVAGQKGQSQTTRQSGVSGTSSSRSSQGQRTQGHQHIQTRDIYGNTPLHYLASSSSLALQRYLNDPDEPFATRWSLGLVPQYDNSSRVKHLLALIRDRQQHFASVDQHIESVPDTGRSQLQLVAKQSPGSSGVLQGSFAHRTHQRTFRLPSHGVKQSVYFEAATLLQHSHFISNLNTIPMTIVHWWEEATPPSVCKTISNGSTTDGPAISYGSKMGPGSPFSLHVRDLNTPEFSTHKAGVGTTDLVSIHDLGRNWNSSWPEKKSSALNWYLEHWHEDFELTRGDILVMLQYTAPKTREDYFKNVLSPTDREQMIQYWWSLFKFMKALTILHRGKPDDGCKDITQGFHQDIKPVNILLTINDSDNPFEGQFKLADLRISHFNRADQLQQNSTATDRQGTRTYGKPHRLQILESACSS